MYVLGAYGSGSLAPMIVMGVGAVFIIIVEILMGNGKRWPIWSLGIAACIWLYVGIATIVGASDSDPSLAWLLSFVVAPLAVMPYGLFRLDEAISDGL